MYNYDTHMYMNQYILSLHLGLKPEYLIMYI